MTKRTPVQHSFSAGEISPRLWRRSDTQQHRRGLSLCQNNIPTPHGTSFFRMGMRYERPPQDGFKQRLYRFRTDEQDYLLEFGQLALRIGDQAFPSPYLSDELPEVQFAQDNRNRMFVFHGNHPPMLLTLQNATWTQTIEVPFTGLPSVAFNDDLSPTVTGMVGAAVFTFGAINEGQAFRLSYAGQETADIVYTSNASLLKARIEAILSDILRIPEVSINSGVNAVVNYPNFTIEFLNGFAIYPIDELASASAEVTLNSSGASGEVPTAEPAFSDVRGYPRSGAFFGQRLLMASTKSLPNTVWASRIGTPLDMAVGPNASDPLQFEVSSETPIDIRWMSSRGTLVFGTSTGDFVLFGQLTSTLDFQIRQQNSKPSARRQPVKIGASVVYLQEGRRKLRSLSFFDSSQTWESVNLSFVAEHMLRVPVMDMAYSENPDGMLWLCRDDGLLLSFTHSPTQNVGAWARHPGTLSVHSVALQAATDGDELHLSGVRSGVRSIERIPMSNTAYTDISFSSFDEGDGLRYTVVRGPDSYLDGSIEVAGTNPTITGLDHLNGQIVSAVVDGRVHPEKRVINGSITLDYSPRAQTFVGVKYGGVMRTLPKQPDHGVHKWGQVEVALIDSAPPHINGEREYDRSLTDNLDEGIGYKQGRYSVTTNAVEDAQDGILTIEQRDPLPCHITTIWGALNSARK